MFKNQPKGLIIAFFTNMGERFGFYTMMAILVLFLQARYGLNENVAGDYYSWFYFAIYALALVGGILADSTKKYKTVIFAGQVIMFGGYCLMAVPGVSLTISLIALFIIAFGNGLFKGNLQAVVGQLYDNEQYAKYRDSAFMIFYMGINIGAFFAPFVATSIRDWWLSGKGFEHDGSLPSLCHNFLNGKLTDVSQFQTLADKVSGNVVTDLTTFANQYLGAFSEGYNWAFAVAAVAMIISLVIYMIFNKTLPSVDKVAKAGAKEGEKKSDINIDLKSVIISLGLMAVTALIFYLFNADLWPLGLAVGLFIAFCSLMFQISTKEERARVTSLILVFVVVIFFWMSFHQNGLTLTFFARDYIVKEVGPVTNLFFNLNSILCVILAIVGIALLLKPRDKSEDLGRNAEEINKAKGSNLISRIIGGVVFALAGYGCYYFVNGAGSSNPIGPEVFQSFNPLFIVALTPLVMGAFTWLNKKGIEPSTPKKIGIGMIIAAIGFVFVLLPSIGIMSPKDLAGDALPESMRITPYWLISTYLVLTIAELFLSPMGLSFVSKVAPPRFQGLMQSGWLLATATGNKLLFIGSAMWGRIDLYLLWGVFIICCILSAVFIFSIMKRLEKVAK